MSTQIIIVLILTFIIYRSIPKLLFHGFSKSGIKQFEKSLIKPKKTKFLVYKGI